MADNTLHVELKKALMLFDLSISEWARGLEKPDGSVGISHTAVIQVAQRKDTTQWILDEINDVIHKAHREFPEYYKRTSSLKAEID